MPASAEKKPIIPISSKMLSWARENAGVSVEAAAKRAGVKPDRVADWERPESEIKPTVRQARELARLYGREFIEFFRAEPPPEIEPSAIADFRLHRGAEDPSELREMREIRIWAEAQRENALTLFSDIGDDVPEFPEKLFVPLGSDVEAAALSAREVMGLKLDELAGLKTADRKEIPNILRQRIESLGVLCLKHTQLHRLGARGFCIATFPLPIVVFGTEAQTAQSFTLLHEFGHVMLKSSAISGPINRSGKSEQESEIEAWCDQLAAAFMMPKDIVLALVPKPKAPAASIDDGHLAFIAGYFGISPHAALIRLLELEYVDPKFYWGVKKAQFEAEEAAYKAFGRATYYGSRYRNALGDLYTGLVLEAWGSGKITNHHAAEYMGISNLAHLKDIREHFRD